MIRSDRLYLSEQHRMYQMAYEFVHYSHYHIVYVKEDEVWLEKYEQKTSKVIRLIHKGFNWKNHLKNDIAKVFQAVKTMRPNLLGKNIEVSNVYVSSDSPVDDWEIFKKPLQLNEKNPLKMQVYYIKEDNFQSEYDKLKATLNIDIDEAYKQLTDDEREAGINQYKRYLYEKYEAKKNERNNIFSFGKPFLTYILMAISIAMFFVLETSGGSTNVENLIRHGAKYNPLIIDGEWWRLVSSMFLHIGLLHLVMNMLALYYLGTVVERIFGSVRYLFIYMLAGIAGSLTSFVFILNVSAGASGAIFGLFGALLYFGIIHRKLFFQTMGSNILTVLGLNLVIGFIVPEIDASAHIGGLIAGFIAAAIVHLPKHKNRFRQLLALISYFILLTGLIFSGLHNDTNQLTYQLTKIDEHLEAEDYEAVLSKTTNALKSPGDFESQLLFQRSIAYIYLGADDLAINDLENSISLNNKFPEAHYNLAILYYSTNLIEKAEESAREAYQLKQDDEAYLKLYEQMKEAIHE